jgi:hypothetical protein
LQFHHKVEIKMISGEHYTGMMFYCKMDKEVEDGDKKE